MLKDKLVEQGKKEIVYRTFEAAKELHIGIADFKWTHSSSNKGKTYEVEFRTDSDRIADRKFTEEQLIGFKNDNRLLMQVEAKIESLRLQLKGR